MVHYKLTYFDARGRAEVVRLILAAAGQKYEDNRVPKAQWMSVKPSTPWGSMPVLEVDGKQLAQTPVIIHYLASEHGLAGHGHFEQALVDSVVAAAMDLWQAGAMPSFMPDGPEKEAAFKKFKEQTVPTTLNQLEQFIGKHGKDGHAVGHKLTSADIAIFNAFDQMFSHGGPQDILDKFPHVKGVFEKVQKDSKIAEYLKTRK